MSPSPLTTRRAGQCSRPPEPPGSRLVPGPILLAGFDAAKDHRPAVIVRRPEPEFPQGSVLLDQLELARYNLRVEFERHRRLGRGLRIEDQPNRARPPRIRTPGLLLARLLADEPSGLAIGVPAQDGNGLPVVRLPGSEEPPRPGPASAADLPPAAPRKRAAGDTNGQALSPKASLSIVLSLRKRFPPARRYPVRHFSQNFISGRKNIVKRLASSADRSTGGPNMTGSSWTRLALIGALCAGLANARDLAAEAYGKLPLYFEPNRGQSLPEVKFVARTAQYTVFLTSDGITLRGRDGGMVKMTFPGARPRPPVDGVNLQEGRFNYLIGNDSRRLDQRHTELWERRIPRPVPWRNPGLLRRPAAVRI